MIPQFTEKHAYPSLITPSKMLEHRRQYGRLPATPPPHTVIFCYQGRFLAQVLENFHHQPSAGCFSHLFYLTDYPATAISAMEMGAPLAAARMEELIAWGVKQFISIGVAGSLQPQLGIGDILLCEKAVRDEGTSHHYIAPSKYIHAPRRMTNRLRTLLIQENTPHHLGVSWTIDSLYRQTAAEVTHYQQEGVMTVDMETAALFAVAHFHQIDLGAMFTISDTHAELDWKPHFEDERPRKSLHQLLRIALLASQMPS